LFFNCGFDSLYTGQLRMAKNCENEQTTGRENGLFHVMDFGKNIRL
jgi:hypothetical protein